MGVGFDPVRIPLPRHLYVSPHFNSPMLARLDVVVVPAYYLHSVVRSVNQSCDPENLRMRSCRLMFSIALLFTLPLRAQERPSLEDLKQQAIAAIDARQAFTQQMVDQIFSYAELGFQEHETSRYLTDILEKNGFKVESGLARMPTAWIGTHGSGKPVIAFISDLDCIPRASQKPGVAYHDPIIEGAPGHGEGHNSGMAVNVTAALVLKQLMEKHK